MVIYPLLSNTQCFVFGRTLPIRFVESGCPTLHSGSCVLWGLAVLRKTRARQECSLSSKQRQNFPPCTSRTSGACPLYYNSSSGTAARLTGTCIRRLDFHREPAGVRMYGTSPALILHIAQQVICQSLVLSCCSVYQGDEDFGQEAPVLLHAVCRAPFPALFLLFCGCLVCSSASPSPLLSVSVPFSTSLGKFWGWDSASRCFQRSTQRRI